MPNFCICISVFACICVCLHVFECVCLCVNMFVSVCVVCRPKVDVRPKVSFSIFFSLYFFKIKSPTEPGAQGLSQATRPISPRGLPSLIPQCWGFRHMLLCLALTSRSNLWFSWLGEPFSWRSISPVRGLFNGVLIPLVRASPSWLNHLPMAPLSSIIPLRI